MAPAMVLNPIEVLDAINSEFTTEILTELKSKYVSGELSNFTMIGIARNELLGVFKLEKNGDGYDCYRICMDNGKLVISDVGYPVTNIGNRQFSISCVMDFVMPVKFLILI